MRNCLLIIDFISLNLFLGLDRLSLEGFRSREKDQHKLQFTSIGKQKSPFDRYKRQNSIHPVSKRKMVNKLSKSNEMYNSFMSFFRAP